MPAEHIRHGKDVEKVAIKDSIVGEFGGDVKVKHEEYGPRGGHHVPVPTRPRLGVAGGSTMAEKIMKTNGIKAPKKPLMERCCPCFGSNKVQTGPPKPPPSAAKFAADPLGDI